MAIILHEIGHNFQTSLNKTSMLLCTLKKTIMVAESVFLLVLGIPIPFIINAMINTNKMKELMANMNENLNKNHNNISSFFDSYNSMINTINHYAIKMMNTIFLFNGGIGGYIINLIRSVIRAYNPLHLINSFLGYNNEKISDDFAAIYGYGSDLSSALLKMSYTPVEQGEFMTMIDSINETMMLPYYILCAPTDEHPDTIVRAKSMIKYLEDELLRNNIDPKMKKEIEKNIKDINDSLDKLVFKNTSEDTKSY